MGKQKVNVKNLSYKKTKYDKGFWIALSCTIALLGAAIVLAALMGIRFSWMQSVMIQFNENYAAAVSSGQQTFTVSLINHTFNVAEFKDLHGYKPGEFFNVQEEEIWIYLSNPLLDPSGAPGKIISHLLHNPNATNADAARVEKLISPLFSKYSTTSNSSIYGAGIALFLFTGVSALCTVFVGLPVTLKNKNAKKEAIKELKARQQNQQANKQQHVNQQIQRNVQIA